MEGYPKRQRFFALRFCRLMAKVCLANDIGPEACWLLAVIANTEDAKGYRDAVTFFNGQLMPLVGLMSVPSLDRARKKAIDSGWLHYQAGGKSKAGTYWVKIPAKHLGWDDAPTDENPQEYSQLSGSDLSRLDGVSGNESSPETLINAEDKRSASVAQAEDNRSATVHHSSYTKDNLALSQERGRLSGDDSLLENSSIKNHEAGYAPIPFKDKFEQLIERYPYKAPPGRAVPAWKKIATSEEVVLKIELAAIAWIEFWGGKGVPTLANFLGEGWWQKHPDPPKEKLDVKAKRAERTSGRYDPATHG